jgi:exopolysaccharide biosynthesis polyprenyl glycosylphosphotransferase
MLTSTVLLWAVLRATGDQDTAFKRLLVFATVAVAAMLALRSLARRALPYALGPERVLLVGDGPEIAVLARKMRSHPEYALEPVGVVSRSGLSPAGCDVPVLCSVADLDLERLVWERRIERVVVARLDGPGDEDADPNHATRLGILRSCKELSMKVSVVPQLFDAMGSSVVVDDVEGMTLVGINPPVLGRSSRALKRAMDITGAGLLLVLTAVPCLIIAVAIRLDSRGPVLFRQRRVGEHGRPFRIAKFRTMEVGAEARQDELRAQSTDPGWLLIAADPRVTRVGAFLRRTSLDELPQILNVLKGEMSLVGPRPLIESEDSQLSGWRRGRVDLRPGLTGLWQILGRTEIPFEEMVKLDYLYVTNWSLWNDVRVMLRTIPVVLFGKGAN